MLFIRIILMLLVVVIALSIAEVMEMKDLPPTNEVILSMKFELTYCPEIFHLLMEMMRRNDDVSHKCQIPDHPLFRTTNWKNMLCGWKPIKKVYQRWLKTPSTVVLSTVSPQDDAGATIYHYCVFKNKENELYKFFDWLCPYIKTEGLIAYVMPYDRADFFIKVYKMNGQIVWKEKRGTF